MADVSQFSFPLAEIAQLMIKDAGIHEGKWVVGVEFNITVGAMGLNNTEAFPGAAVTATKLMLSAYIESGPPQPPNLVFDAAVINPKKV